jgi:hypothetical protein
MKIEKERFPLFRYKIANLGYKSSGAGMGVEVSPIPNSPRERGRKNTSRPTDFSGQRLGLGACAGPHSVLKRAGLVFVRA